MTKKRTQYWKAVPKARNKSLAWPFYHQARKTPNRWVMFEMPKSDNPNDTMRIYNWFHQKSDAKCGIKTLDDTVLVFIKVLSDDP